MHEQNVSKKLNTLIHLGAGFCSELDTYIALKPERLVLVEAVPSLVEALQERTGNLAYVQVISAVVSSQTGHAVFHKYNLPGGGSLRRATGLKDIFPGLKLLEELSVETISAATLVATLQLKIEQNNQLVVDVPGEELSLLEALQKEGLLDGFSELRLHCGRESLYEDSQPANLILNWLRERGFDLTEENSNDDPDRPWWKLQRNSLYLSSREMLRDIAALKATVAKATQARDEQAKLADERQSQLEQAMRVRDEQAKLAAGRQSQLEQAIRARDEQAKLAAERQSQLEQAMRARDEQAKLAAKRQSQLEQVTQAHEEQAKRVAQQQTQLEQVTEAHDEQAKLAAERQSQLEQVIRVRDEQARLATERQAQLMQVTQAGEEQAKRAAERQSQLEQLMQACDEQANLAAERQTQLEQVKQSRDEQARLATERQAQLMQVTQAREEQAKRAAERESQLEQLMQACDEQAKLAAERQTQLEQVMQARDEQAKLAAERLAQLDLVMQARDEQAKLTNEVQKEKNKYESKLHILMSEFESQSKTVADLKKEITEARQTASLSVKLQMLREADLKDLQRRYEDKKVIEENQHHLLVKLSERLSAASSYFHQLSNHQLSAVPEPQKMAKVPKKRVVKSNATSVKKKQVTKSAKAPVAGRGRKKA